jgi:hypothetical protein
MQPEIEIVISSPKVLSEMLEIIVRQYLQKKEFEENENKSFNVELDSHIRALFFLN